mgnify:CR=1 FL=1
MPLATLGTVRIHYDVQGDGEPLVLTQGQGTGPAARAALVAGLAARFRVLTYDQRGSGRSPPAPQGQSMAELAEDLCGLMEVAGFVSAHVVGLSTGTGKATALAALHPHRVRRLVLGAPWTHADDELQQLQNLRKVAARSLPADQQVYFNAGLIYPPDYRRRHRERLAQQARTALTSPSDPQGMAARLDAILAFDARPLYPQIVSPTLVMGAADDLVMPAWHAQDAARAIDGARLVMLDGGGHLFAETRTDEFLSHALPFLQGGAGPSTGVRP